MQLVRNLYLVFALLLVGGATIQVKAQVTIGSSAQPNRAALLDIKDKETPGIHNETATTGGLLLPRVLLVNSATLEPFIALTDADWMNAGTSKIKEKHVGLQVYNLSTSNDFIQGVYVWNGTTWETQEQADQNFEQNVNYFFHLPSFNIEIEVGPNRQIDLYAEYEKQFTRSLNTKFVSNSNYTAEVLPKAGTDRLYRRDELYYVITDFDSDIINYLTLQLTDDGKFIYDVIGTATMKKSYMNVLFVVKR